MNDSIITFFLTVCQKLDDLALPYMLTGSAAMNYYSVIRTTQDLDIVLELREDELDLIITFMHRASFQKSNEKGYSIL